MRSALPLFVLLLILLTLLPACGEQPARDAQPTAARNEPDVPKPPVRETFEGEPQISLFPRVGGERPEGDPQEVGIWTAYVEHLMRLSGVADQVGRNNSRGWVVASLRSVGSVGFFVPLAVQPNTTYRVSFDFAGELPKGGSAGVGALELDRFLWISDQLTKAQLKEHQTGLHQGVRLTGRQEWGTHTFTFTTSPRAGMIHLVLFREGAADRKQPVRFDNIVVEAAAGR